MHLAEKRATWVVARSKLGNHDSHRCWASVVRSSLMTLARGTVCLEFLHASVAQAEAQKLGVYMCVTYAMILLAS